jgi:4-coumarate--CoA ligase
MSATQSAYDIFAPSHPAYIDGPTGIILTRGDMRKRTLEIGWGLMHLEEIARDTNAGLGMKLAQGNTIMIFSPNSLAYPVMLHGAVAAGLRVTLANTAYTPCEFPFHGDISCYYH